MRRVHLLILILLTLTACGKKGPVRPLELPLPAAPSTFEIRQRGDDLLLGWTIPTVNQDGTPLRNLDKFLIFRMRFLPQEDCPECRDTSTLWREVALDYLQDARRVDNRLFVTDTEVELGYGYQYRIVPATTRGRTGAPAVARRAVQPSPGAPERLVATGHDRMVRLSWEPPPAPDSPAGYTIYRRAEGDPPPLLPLNAELITDNFYEDFGLENGLSYLYTVRSVTGSGVERVESLPSETVSAIPEPGN